MSTDIGLGDLLRRARTERDEPLRVVAAAAGIDSTLLSRIERGERLPTPPQLQALAAHFGLPDDELEALGDAARIVRSWGGADAVLRAADVIEAHTSSSRPGSPSRARARISETHDSMRLSREMPAGIASFSMAAPRSGRADRLAELEGAAADGLEALGTLESAAHDRDSVIALRAAELLRQLRSRLG
jgi:transcriptional regulator with XRE-family HTH domain